MNLDQCRSLVHALPYFEETIWGDKLVFWVGHKPVGGKMFAIGRLGTDLQARKVAWPVLSFCVGPDWYPDLLDSDGVQPAPYLARAYWVALEHWAVFPAEELEAVLRRAHALKLANLSKRTRAMLAANPSVVQARG